MSLARLAKNERSAGSRLGDLRTVVAIPRHPLSDYVEALVTVDARCGFPSIESLPKPQVELFVDLSRGRTHFGGASSWISGARDNPITLDVAPEESFVCVRFQPGGVWSLLGVPAWELFNRVVPTEDFGPRLSFMGSMRERMLETLDPSERLRVLVEGLETLLPGAIPRARWLDSAIAAELESGGQVSVRGLCERLSVSRRRLVGAFVREAGPTPKRFLRLVRFQRALWLVMETDRPLAEIALECGYHDQSHFTTEFRQLAGKSPVRLRAAVVHQIDGARLVTKSALGHAACTRTR